MKTNLDLKQIIHPNYFLSTEELKMVEEFYADQKQDVRDRPRRKGSFKKTSDFSMKKPAKKLLLSAFALVLAAITVPFVFVTSEAKTDFDISKVEKMQDMIPDLQLKYEEVSKDLTGLTGVVTYLVDSEVKRSEQPKIEAKPQEITHEPEATALRVATVTKEKTPLKLEKSSGSKTIIFVGKDSKLVIKGEEDNWLLVSSPKGGSAWIQKDYLNF